MVFIVFPLLKPVFLHEGSNDNQSKFLSTTIVAQFHCRFGLTRTLWHNGLIGALRRVRVCGAEQERAMVEWWVAALGEKRVGWGEDLEHQKG